MEEHSDCISQQYQTENEPVGDRLHADTVNLYLHLQIHFVHTAACRTAMHCLVPPDTSSWEWSQDAHRGTCMAQHGYTQLWLLPVCWGKEWGHGSKLFRRVCPYLCSCHTCTTPRNFHAPQFLIPRYRCRSSHFPSQTIILFTNIVNFADFTQTFGRLSTVFL